jgi:hypothetical protein
VTWHGLIPVEPVGRIDFLLFYWANTRGRTGPFERATCWRGAPRPYDCGGLFKTFPLLVFSILFSLTSQTWGLDLCFVFSCVPLLLRRHNIFFHSLRGWIHRTKGDIPGSKKNNPPVTLIAKELACPLSPNSMLLHRFAWKGLRKQPFRFALPTVMQVEWSRPTPQTNFTWLIPVIIWVEWSLPTPSKKNPKWPTPVIM